MSVTGFSSAFRRPIFAPVPIPLDDS